MPKLHDKEVATLVAAKFSSPHNSLAVSEAKVTCAYIFSTLLCGERKFAATRELNQSEAVMAACPSGGEVLFAVKIMFIPCKVKIISNAYANTTLLCGEKNFAATRHAINAFISGEGKVSAGRKKLSRRPKENLLSPERNPQMRIFPSAPPRPTA